MEERLIKFTIGFAVVATACYIAATITLALFAHSRKQRWTVSPRSPVPFGLRAKAELVDLGNALLLLLILELLVHICYVVISNLLCYDTHSFEYDGHSNLRIVLLSVRPVLPLGILAYQMTRPAQTAGYRRAGISVVNRQYGAHGFIQAFLMKLLAFICLLPLGLGLVPVVRNPPFRTLPDILMGLIAVRLTDADQEQETLTH